MAAPDLSVIPGTGGLRAFSTTGPGFEQVFEGLAQLRISVFHDYPYLYEGDLDYEREYLQVYAQSPRAFLFGVFDGDQLVGATTCMPLADEAPEVQEPFVKSGADLDSIFYFGESVLLPAYRGRGLGHLFFDQREAHAASFGTYRQTCFCAVIRPEDHPLRPGDYQPLDAFWQKRGYQPQPHLQSQFSWRDIGEPASTVKAMQYWMRPL